MGSVSDRTVETQVVRRQLDSHRAPIEYLLGWRYGLGKRPIAAQRRDRGSRAEYYKLAERLQALGFAPDRRERAPLCRWLIDGLTV
jgi:hypothetical protein